MALYQSSAPASAARWRARASVARIWMSPAGSRLAHHRISVWCSMPTRRDVPWKFGTSTPSTSSQLAYRAAMARALVSGGWWLGLRGNHDPAGRTQTWTAPAWSRCCWRTRTPPASRTRSTASRWPSAHPRARASSAVVMPGSSRTRRRRARVPADGGRRRRRAGGAVTTWSVARLGARLPPRPAVVLVLPPARGAGRLAPCLVLDTSDTRGRIADR